MNASQKFQDFLLSRLLPEFCLERALDAAGFTTNWEKISNLDAVDFFRALDGQLITHIGRGQYRATRSGASNQFFNHGDARKIPRPVTLRLEDIISVSVLARLHFDLGWPSGCLGTEIRTATSPSKMEL